jgi:hypothetical protein
MGMAEHIISGYVEKAGQGGSVTISFGRDADGEIPPLRLRCPDGLGYELTAPGA